MLRDLQDGMAQRIHPADFWNWIKSQSGALRSNAPAGLSWADEVKSGGLPSARLHSEPILFWRDEAGAVQALRDASLFVMITAENAGESRAQPLDFDRSATQAPTACY
ncbi:MULTISPECIES: hypothetical protein [Sphingobium]|jgi:hypothetical protein|uniref:Uncharacterized protein n=1 Tax=Sphingobium limneticum TaxID=1007511 RepID=A0A5J5HXC7_9SPHN|nr:MULTISPECIES: hypothetical protein [Sphingobium]KAA9012864.1 hypothetical protein F4U94_17380 [Sphingobium limneticum]KAA9013489.1 hypothetical protein F4U96_18320 [Sphingobium limneticum]KAA9026551.1 hypothetical protein F4U95_18445 [Sphingobium limneticum]MBU0930426.1 hypothetical protein [Alphaproteobacteria bacterium]